MIVLTNTTAQTLQPGQALILDSVILHTGKSEGCACCNGESHRRNTSFVRLNGKGGIYSVFFAANIDGATADAAVQLSLQWGGSTLPETTAISAASGFNNVARQTLVYNDTCNSGENIAIVNTGTIPVTVGANSVLTVVRNS